MFRAIYGASSFNQPLHKWNVSKVEDMRYMFIGARSFNQPLNNWNVSNVTDMYCMFQDATSFNQPLKKWNVRRSAFLLEITEPRRDLRLGCPICSPWSSGPSRLWINPKITVRTTGVSVRPKRVSGGRIASLAYSKWQSRSKHVKLS